MKVIRDLQITASEFFGVVFAELAAEIRAQGMTLEPEALVKGFTQVSHPEDPALKVTFEIVEYQEDRLYIAAQTSASGRTTISYEVTPKADGITVVFNWDNGQPEGKGFMAKFSQLMFLRNMTEKLYDIQRTVINEKEGFTERKSNNPLFPSIRRSK